MEYEDDVLQIAELYIHRHALFAALVKVYDSYKTPLGSHVRCYKSKLHHDGTMPKGWFIVVMLVGQLTGPDTQISYHLPIDWWDKFNIIELERMVEWDGHAPDDVVKRLLEL